jgi:hypothetical protein
VNAVGATVDKSAQVGRVYCVVVGYGKKRMKK